MITNNKRMPKKVEENINLCFYSELAPLTLI